eukprot:8558382-Lingulodinium_polyedra.AAC.1
MGAAGPSAVAASAAEQSSPAAKARPKSSRIPRPATKAALVSRRDARLAKVKDMMSLRDSPDPSSIEQRAEKLSEEAQAAGGE